MTCFLRARNLFHRWKRKTQGDLQRYELFAQGRLLRFIAKSKRKLTAVKLLENIDEYVLKC